MTWNERVQGEPTAADLAAIEAEWPLVEAELGLLDAQIVALSAARGLSPLDWRRLRRAERRVLAAWLRLMTARASGVVRGQRHDAVRYVLQSERMGHEVPGMRGVYAHITPRMRAELRDGLQELWEASLHERALLAERSAVNVLDGILARKGGSRP